MSKKITSIIAHIDHGKTTLMDSLVAFQGHISKSLAGDARILDNRNDEQEREITLKLSLIRLQNEYIFIDTPGHVDFEPLIHCSSILSNNFIIIIDISEGIMPRTYSLIKYIDKNRTILVLNKVDLCKNYIQIEFIIEQINGLIGYEVFSWNKNNIILASAYLCSGICHKLYKFSKKNTLKMAYMSFLTLIKKYEENDVENILKKFNIKYKTKKAIFSSIMPLTDAIFNTIDNLPDNDKKFDIKDKKYKENNNKFIIKNDLYTINGENEPEAIGITVYGMMDKKNNYEIENVLFVVKILKGKFRVGQRVFSITNNEIKEVIIEKICFFSVNSYVEKEIANEEDLVLMKGDFLKNSIISTDILKFELQKIQKPFFSSILSLENITELENIKKVIKAISFTEQCLRVKKNKYNELEFWCGGQVHFEKICNDLKGAGFIFKIKKAKIDLKEYINGFGERHYLTEEIEFKISIEKYEDIENNKSNNDNFHKLFTNENNKNEIDLINKSNWIRKVSNGNLFLIKADNDLYILESVLEIFISQGPLVREKIIRTKIVVELIKSNDKIFNIFKNELTDLYLSADPKIAPRLYRVTILIHKNQIGIVYTILAKHYSIIEDEFFEDKTGFFKLICKVTQFSFDSIAEELYFKTKGMAYIDLEEAGYCFEGTWDEIVQIQRELKGMYINKKIIEDPEKQRTYRK